MIRLNENDLRSVVENSIYRVLNEYHAEQRLPFDDPYYSKKNQLEQYKDWLEDFGKYGELKPSEMNFYEELKKAFKTIESGQLHGRFDAKIPKSSSEMYNKLNSIMFGNLDFDDNGNLYVERSIAVSNEANNVIIDTYHNLIKKYNDNVGGCWSYKKGSSKAYCGHGENQIVFRGRIRIEDIDFVKTALLNFTYYDEFEIRVKPNSKVALDSFSYDTHTVRFKKPLIVSATYFGNNGQYYGDYAPVDDGFGNKEYVDRHGNKFSTESVIKNTLDKINRQLAENVDLEDIFNEVYYDPVNGIHIVSYDFLNEGMFNYIKDNKILSPNLWFYDCGFFSEGLARVSILDKDNIDVSNFIKEDGTLLRPDMWFDEASSFEDGIAIVGQYHNGNLKKTFLKKDGTFLVDKWFEKCDNFVDGFARVALSNNGKLQWYIMNSSGTFINKEPFFYCDPLETDNMILVGTYNNEGKRVYDYFSMVTKSFVNDTNKVHQIRDEQSF